VSANIIFLGTSSFYGHCYCACFGKFTTMMTEQQYQECINACMECAITCDFCASACLNEENVKNLRRCIRLDLECAAICRAAAEVMSLNGQFSEQLCSLCAEVCHACAEECQRHAEMGMEHCRACAEVCRKCAAVCEEMGHVVK
jgi:hypothetical protein